MRNRSAGVTFTLLVVISTAFYLYHTSSSASKSLKMVTQPSIPIKIALSAGSSGLSSTRSEVSLHIKLTNTHPTSAVSFLRWSTPLDPLAAPMGLFVVKPISDSNSEPLPTLNLKVNRRMPKSEIFSIDDEQIITLQVGDSVERDILLHEPEYAGLVGGKKYAVGVAGTWHGVWVHDEELAELSAKEGSSLLRGSFEVEGVEVSASEAGAAN